MPTFNEALATIPLVDRALCKVGRAHIDADLREALAKGYDYNDLAKAFHVATGMKVHSTSISRHLRRSGCGCADAALDEISRGRLR